MSCARARIVEAVERLEDIHVSELCKRLSDATPVQPQQISLEEIYFTLQEQHNGQGGASK